MTDRLATLTLLAFAGLLLSRAVPAGAADEKKPSSVLDFKVQDIDGKAVDLSKYKGEVLLVVNTASKCGYTPQYKGLEEVYGKYKGQGFEVLAFPANEFGQQEPGANPEIKQFCTANYNVTFPLFSKIVVKGPGIHPLYQFLTSQDTDPKFAGDIPWNFAKFLVNRKGEVIARFAPGDKPESEKVTRAIEAALTESK
jgi:glutathione peroxidase